ncbi:hypothetical protein CSQ95_21965 [Janthinobacterium sp. BJB304]|nr:hypothetical protein CSQ95_21965 [Janthinobacterium sp. BJB304]
MLQNQNKTVLEQLMELTYKAWCWHNMLKSLTMNFLSSDLGQWLLTGGTHLLQQLEPSNICGILHSVFPLVL